MSKILSPLFTLRASLLSAVLMMTAGTALAAGSQRPACEMPLSSSDLQALMRQYVPRGSNGRAPAASFLEVDSNGRVLREVYTQNPHKAQAVASTQKMITVYTAYKNGGLDRMVTWNSADVQYDSQGSNALLRSTGKRPTVGQTVRSKDFLWTVITHSSNGGSLALSRSISSGSTKAFVESMNALSRNLIGGESPSYQTYFQNPAGLTDNDDRYAFGDPRQTQRSTADNMARLTARMMGDSGFRSAMASNGLPQFNGGVVVKGGSTQAAGKTIVAHIPLAKCRSRALSYAVFGEGTTDQWNRISQMHNRIVQALGH